MTSIKAAFAASSAWLDETWAKHGSAAILAFLIGAALMMACQDVAAAVKQMLK